MLGWTNASIPKGRKVSDAELDEVHIRRNKFQGDWNYEIHPHDRDDIPVVYCFTMTYPTAAKWSHTDSVRVGLLHLRPLLRRVRAHRKGN